MELPTPNAQRSTLNDQLIEIQFRSRTARALPPIRGRAGRFGHLSGTTESGPLTRVDRRDCDGLLRFRAGNSSPVRGSNILDPPQVNGVVYVILLVDIAWQHRDDHFETCGRHRRVREKLEVRIRKQSEPRSAYMKSSH